MDDFELEQPVMAMFSCNREMARTILKASKTNGEYEAIKRMCLTSQSERRKEGYHA